MCLLLYMATHDDLPLQTSVDIRVEEVETSRDAIRQWFSLPEVHFIGAHTGCSCGFPHIIAEEPIEYYEGMFNDDEERLPALRSVDLLLALVRESVIANGEVQLYSVWNGNEGLAPKGVIDVALGSLRRETFFLNEQFFYHVTIDGE
jgi:hypothetical protein